MGPCLLRSTVNTWHHSIVIIYTKGYEPVSRTGAREICLHPGTRSRRVSQDAPSGLNRETWERLRSVLGIVSRSDS